jgi:hypothetical protein
MFRTPLYAFGPYSAEPGPRISSMLENSSIGYDSAAHSCEPRKGTEGSRPSMRVRMRRFSVVLNPRALKLKSYSPLCVKSTPGALSTTRGA